MIEIRRNWPSSEAVDESPNNGGDSIEKKGTNSDSERR